MISRRGILSGLFAAPAIVAVSSLMPIRGATLIMPSELDVNEIAALLAQRLHEGDGGWNETERRWRTLKYAGDGVFVHYTGYDTLKSDRYRAWQMDLSEGHPAVVAAREKAERAEIAEIIG